MRNATPTSEDLPLVIRAFAESGRPNARPKRRHQWPSEHMVVFDCETMTEAPQALRFGTYQQRKGAALQESGLFYAEDIPPHDFAVLETFASENGLNLRTRESFVHDVLYRYGYHLRGTIVGFNLPFDLARVAVKAGIARGAMYGGFSLTMSEDKRLPSLQVKHASRRFSLIRFAAPFRNRSARSARKRGDRGSVNRGFFVDVSTLASALFARSFKLDALAEHLKVPSPKLVAVEHGVDLTPDYVEYAVRDTQTTYECFAELVRRYEGFGLAGTPAHAIYSEASLGKAYLDAMNIKTWRELQPDVPTKLIATIMSAYFGGRSEVRVRRELREVIHTDFLSMYPTVCTLMGLWSFVTAKGMTWRDGTDEVRHILEKITVEALQQSARWRQLNALVEIAADEDVLPVRARYEDGLPSTIGLNYLSADEGLWYTLADCIAAKLLTGRAPKILGAIIFKPGEPQSGLRAVDVSGNPEFRVDPRTEDFFKRTVELRKSVEACAEEASLDEAAVMKAEALGLKIVANATSYGGFVELNVQELSKPKDVHVHSANGEPFSHPTMNEERPGRYFHPLLATLITGAARLMLAITEHLAIDRGLHWAFCDTDSMSFAKPAHLERGEFRDRVSAIVSWFEPLNPYEFPGSILKVEKINYSLSHPGELEPLYAWCVSAKRYALFNVGDDGRPVIRKASAHGLGHLIAPYDERSSAASIPPPSVKLSDIGVELWQHDLWWQIVSSALSGDPDRVDLSYHPALRGPAISRYAATSPRLLRWFQASNEGRTYRDQVKPFGFLYSLFAGELGEVNATFPGGRSRSSKSATMRPVALYNRDLGAAVKSAFDRETGTSISSSKLRSYQQTLAQYHLQPEAKFLNGDYLDRGTTRRRHVRLTGIELIGKEANRWEEQEHLGLFADAEITHGYPADPSAELACRLRTLKADFSYREQAYRLGWPRSRIAKLAGGMGVRLPWAAAERALRALTRLQAEAEETRDEIGRVRAEIRLRVGRDGLLVVAAALKVDPSNLSKIAEGQRRPTTSLLERLSGAPHAR